MSIDIDPLYDDAGITVTDHIENTQFELYTDRPVRPRSAPVEDHYFPVDVSVTVETGCIEIPRAAVVAVRRADGTLITRGDDLTMPDGEYIVSFDPAPTKLYLNFSSAFSVTTTAGSTTLKFGDAVDVTLGFRSLHQKPAGTITTPKDPESVMDAVSLLGSSLSTTSPERSFPTLRGHPPLIEPGEQFDVPKRVDPPDSGVRIVVPPEYEYVYPVISLAYYFAADVVPGDSPRVEGDGWEFPLEPDFERTTAAVLRQSFHLDCVTRTEGYYPVNLHERESTELELDWGSLYDMPLAERLGEYLDVPFERIEPELPQWMLTTDIRPDGENVEMVPFIAAELSIVRSPRTVSRPSESDEKGRSSVLHTSRGKEVGIGRGGRQSTPPLSSQGSAPNRARGFMPDDADFVQPNSVDTVEHVWVGEGVPLGANKATLGAYKRRITAGSADQSRISVLVVCNDDLMREEGRVGELYGLRDMVQFDIDVRHDLTREEMRETLRSDVDFLHYIGHVDESGMQCADGYLDLTKEDLTVGVSAFLLNACQSYEQGEALIHRGSRGGIVTLSDVANTPATQLGRIVARLMNSGFNLRTALHVAKRELITGHQYIVVGDGGVTICQSRSGVALVVALERVTDDCWNLSASAFPNGPYGNGTLTTLNMESVQSNYYVPAQIDESAVTDRELADFFNLETAPIFYDGNLTWSDEFSVD